MALVSFHFDRINNKNIDKVYKYYPCQIYMAFMNEMFICPWNSDQLMWIGLLDNR